MDRPNRRPRPALAARLLALALATVAMPALGPRPVAAAATSDYAANCSVNVRDTATLNGTVLDVIAIGSVVTVTSEVAGDSWSANCAGNVSGSTWFEISAVGGASVSSLYGVPVAYAAAGLFRPSTLLEGIDISHWQGAVDFGQVAAAGKHFVVAKATEGIGFTDSKWAR